MTTSIEGWWNAPGASFSAWQRRLEQAGVVAKRTGKHLVIEKQNALALPSWIYRDCYILQKYGVLTIEWRWADHMVPLLAELERLKRSA